MRRRIIQNVLADIICGLFILLFTYTALSKLYGYRQFTFVLSMAPLVRSYAKLLGLVIPVAELIIAALIFIPATAKKGMIAGTGLLMLFTCYLIFMVATDPNLPCSCGGVIQQMSWKQHIAFNIFFIAVGIIGIFMQRENLRKAKNL